MKAAINGVRMSRDRSGFTCRLAYMVGYNFMLVYFDKQINNGKREKLYFYYDIDVRRQHVILKYF